MRQILSQLRLLAAGLLLLPGLISFSGCGSASATAPIEPIDASAAQALLTAALDAWKSGVKYSGQIESNGTIRVADEDWQVGAKLIDFKLGEPDSSKVVGAGRSWPVKLRLQDAKGRAVARSTSYTVTAQPVASIIRQD